LTFYPPFCYLLRFLLGLSNGLPHPIRRLGVRVFNTPSFYLLFFRPLSLKSMVVFCDGRDGRCVFPAGMRVNGGQRQFRLLLFPATSFLECTFPWFSCVKHCVFSQKWRCREVPGPPPTNSALLEVMDSNGYTYFPHTPPPPSWSPAVE